MQDVDRYHCVSSWLKSTEKRRIRIYGLTAPAVRHPNLRPHHGFPPLLRTRRTAGNNKRRKHEKSVEQYYALHRMKKHTYTSVSLGLTTQFSHHWWMITTVNPHYSSGIAPPGLWLNVLFRKSAAPLHYDNAHWGRVTEVVIIDCAYDSSAAANMLF